MGGNSFGSIFRVTTFGESHGKALGCVIDGCPAGLAVDEEDIRKELRRRRPGGGASTTRNEADDPEILSGVFEGKTLGTPIAIIIRNTGQRSADYDELKDIYRPGHADWSWQAKYGRRDHRGGGRSSGRETAGRTAAGAVAKKLLAEKGVSIYSWVSSIAGIDIPGAENSVSNAALNAAAAEKNPFRVPNNEYAGAITEKIAELREQGDSAGGIVTCVVSGLPAGLGEPVFDKLEALLAQAVLSLGAAKAVEFGAGFAAASSTGSQNNDPLIPGTPANAAAILPAETLPAGFAANNAGGVLGGISSGQELFFRTAFKPAASIAKQQQTVDSDGKGRAVSVKGRHDICIAPRASIVVEAMTALVLADLLLRQRSARL